MTIQDTLSQIWAALPRPEKTHLPPAIESGVAVAHAQVGDLFVYESPIGYGAPIVLVHSVNAAASSYEMRPLFESLRGERPVIAFDLPGFGLSERGDRQYDRAAYRNAVTTIMKRAHDHYGKPVDLVALSLGCEFAAAAALENPEWVRSLTMISPTGFNLPNTQSEPGNIAKKLLAMLGAPLFGLLASRTSIEYFLEKSFIGAIDVGLARYAWISAHQEGARFAPLAFLSGALFNKHIRSEVYEELHCKVHVIYDSDAYTTFATLHTTADYRGWTTTRISPTHGLPQFDRPERTVAAMEAFWSELPSSAKNLDGAKRAIGENHHGR